MLPARTAVLVNVDFKSRARDAAYEADAAVLETAAAIEQALRALDVHVERIEVDDTLDDVIDRIGALPTVFNLVESIANDYGREWELPALLDRHGVRYTGNGARPLGLCREKDRAREVLQRAGVRVAPGWVITGADELGDELLATLSFPCFVKPARVDGSIGVDASSRCEDARALRATLARLAALPGPYLVEAYLPGKEINVALFPEPARGHAVATEIDFSALAPELPRFVTYDSKWNPASPEYVARSVPAQLEPTLRDEVERMARAAFLALGGKSYGRVDMRLDDEGRPCVIDVNPNNDLHPEAGLALAARSIGVDYPSLIGSILESAHAEATGGHDDR